MTVPHDGLAVDWLGYATARLEGEGVIAYTDPGRYGVLTGEWDEEYGLEGHPSGGPYDAQDGDLVVVTHDHHYDDDGVRRVASEDATVLVYEGVSAEGVADNSGRDVVEPEELPYDVRRVEYGDELTVEGVDVEVVPAYNREDGPRADDEGNVAHPRGLGCGFVLTIDDTPCFWTGDSDVVDEHDGLDVSLLMPSIARSFTMDRHDAAELAGDLRPDLVVPIHYNTFDDLRSESREFAGDVASRAVPVALDEGGDRLA
ncbi:MBL fold metallo-hydrolase [Saliphagus infecundisoli]|uniref:MBL fold metallo-hydrolase n=1 Tax=Saliphagus infecundisoli TaxID=1849069 RepID=A0ABD5QK98_9EURY|nr:MBL fold metallo-hydrolase [Saliphagus infecundisoli]